MLDRREKIHKNRRNMQCAYYYGTIITWNDLDKYFDDMFYSALEVWSTTKLFGLPNNAGWANEPRAVVDAYRTLEYEQNKIENERMQKQIDESKRKTPSSKKG